MGTVEILNIPSFTGPNVGKLPVVQLAPAYPADLSGVTAASAYSLRKVVSTYTGPAVRVRRSTDNVEANIGFTSYGRLDLTALTAHVGSADGFVVTWFSQAGTGKDFTQATTTAQPKLVNAGTLVTTNGRPAVQFDGTSDFLGAASTGLYAAGASTIVVAAKAPKSTDTGALGLLVEAGTTAGYGIQWAASGAPRWMINTDTGAGIAFPEAYPAANKDEALHLISATDTGSALAIWDNKTAALAPFGYTRSGALTITATRTGRSAPTWYSGNVSEIITWTSALSAPARQAVENEMMTYLALT